MATVIVSVQLVEGGRMPSKSHPGDAGYDLYARIGDDVFNAGPNHRPEVQLHPGKTLVVPVGFKLGLNLGYEAQIRPRSGLAAKRGITVLNTPGTIDAGYRGEVAVILHHTGEGSFLIRDGDRIAQMVIAPVLDTHLDLVDSLDDTDRGSGGFGSTGD